MANITFNKGTLSSYVLIDLGDHEGVAYGKKYHVKLADLDLCLDSKSEMVHMMLMGDKVKIKPEWAGYETAEALFNYIKGLK